MTKNEKSEKNFEKNLVFHVFKMLGCCIAVSFFFHYLYAVYLLDSRTEISMQAIIINSFDVFVLGARLFVLWAGYCILNMLIDVKEIFNRMK